MIRILAFVFTAICAPAQSAVPPTVINKIADIAYNHSEVVETAAYLTDSIGARLTNSPSMRRAEHWTQERFKQWGMSNVRAEGFEFGRGWWIEDASAQMLAPRKLPLRSIPVAWTPPTRGALRAPIVVAPLHSIEDFATWRGKLAGKIVLISYPSPPSDAVQGTFTRLSDSDIKKLDSYEGQSVSPLDTRRKLARETFDRQFDEFLHAEGALAWASMSPVDGGVVHGTSKWGFRKGDTPRLPGIEIAAEDYRRLTRLAKAGSVTIEINNNVHYDDADSSAYNIFAEIPGLDRGAEYVMAGAHLDSWVASDGAADNAAGVAIVMEAGRIIKELGIKPKRTIRIALWSGEEQVFGSYPYTDRHLARRPKDSPDTAGARRHFSQPYPVVPLEGYRELAAYFNVDNGSGRIRGIYAEGNFAAVPVLRDWLAPLQSAGASAVVAGRTSATDHIPMVRIGLPAFQFIQDPLDYSSVVHHTSLDSFDHLRASDLRQAAMVVATVLLAAANADERLPANIVPTTPKTTDPFEYEKPIRH